MSSAVVSRIYQFQEFRLIPAEGLLLRHDTAIDLNPKAFAVLVMLVENHGHLVSKSEILDAVWDSTFIEEGAISKAVWFVRKALGDNSKENFIKTVPKRGYRFVAPVSVVNGSGAFRLDDLQGANNHVEERVSSPVKPLTNGSPGAGSIIVIGTEEQEEFEPSKVFEVSPNHVYANGSNGPNLTSTVPQLAQASRLTSWRIKRSVVIALLLLTSAFGLTYFVSFRPIHSTAVSGTKSIAVLPFRHLDENESDRSLGLGIADALIIKLGQIDQLIVRPTSNVRRFTDQTNVDAITAGRSLGVDTVVEGTIQRSDNRMRITVQTINVSNGGQIWSATIEADSADIFGIQDLVALRVANSFVPELTRRDRANLIQHGTNDLEAFQLCARGYYLAYQGNGENWDKAIGLLNQAIERDPKYALPYARLSEVYFDVSEWRLPPHETMPKAKAFAEKALSLNDALPEAHDRLGWVKWSYDFDWIGAESHIKRAIELEPNNADAHSTYSWFLSFTGRHEEAMAAVSRVDVLQPLNQSIFPFYLLRDYDETIRRAEKSLELRKNNVVALQWLGLAYEKKGMYTEAFDAFQKAREVDDTPDMKAFQGRILALSGKSKDALNILSELKEVSKQRYVSPYFIAIVYAGLNDRDNAFLWLEKAFQNRSYWIASLKVNPQLDSLRDDPQFDGLLRRVGFPVE